MSANIELGVDKIPKTTLLTPVLNNEIIIYKGLKKINKHFVLVTVKKLCVL
jgi:hypothetical protein